MRDSFLTKLGVVLVVIVAFIDGILVANHYHNKTENVKALEAVELESIFEQYEEEEEVIEVEDAESERSVPFTSQAPDGIWDDPWADFAEEAVISMVLHWNKQEDILSREQARVSMLDIAQFAPGEQIDLVQIQTILRENLAIPSVLEDNPRIDSLSAAIQDGAVIILSVNGQTLDNPFYGDPAPVHHTILLYDVTETSFIAHDPGTSRGEAYEYDKQKILESIQDLNGEFRVLIIQP